MKILKTLELKEIIDTLLLEGKHNGTLETNGMYQFFPAQSSGNDVIVDDPKDHSKVLERFSFPRQSKEPYLCLSDFLKPVESGVMDSVGFPRGDCRKRNPRGFNGNIKNRENTFDPMPSSPSSWNLPRLLRNEFTMLCGIAGISLTRNMTMLQIRCSLPRNPCILWVSCLSGFRRSKAIIPSPQA